jgi:hypothetical protein
MTNALKQTTRSFHTGFTLLAFAAIVLTGFSCSNDRSSFTATDNSLLLDSAGNGGIDAQEGFVRCQRYLDAWLAIADSSTGLIPRNVETGIDFWNAKDAAADNYPFMTLSAFFVDQDLFDGRMHDMLATEKRLTSRVRTMPDTYSFSKASFLSEDVKMDEIVFGTSEYIKDGLLPLTEWLGTSPWSDRMIEMLYDMHKEIEIAGTISAPEFGQASKEEVNGELLQVLSRLYWMTGDEALLNWAINIGDHYLLGDHHPTRDLQYLRLRDHGCELISGLCELYATVNFAKPDVREGYREPLHEMLDRILEVGRNEDGMFYDAINPQTGQVTNEHLADTWGYTLNGYYTIFLIDGTEAYRDAILQVFDALSKYRRHAWEGGSADGYADAIESAINLYNRIPDSKVSAWIDSEIRVMWEKQQAGGLIEGWHGDGNFARTTIMYNLWKSKGLYIKPWRPDVQLGAVMIGDTLFVRMKSSQPWKGNLYFDKARYRENMKLPIDWPRINQFPEWYTVSRTGTYDVHDVNTGVAAQHAGMEMTDRGIKLKVSGTTDLIINTHQSD